MESKSASNKTSDNAKSSTDPKSASNKLSNMSFLKQNNTNTYNAMKNNSQHRQTNTGKNSYSRRTRKHDSQIGTGASLLNRKARGAVGSALEPKTGKDFDYESSALEFDKEKKSTMISSLDEEKHNTTTSPDNPISAYKKDDFFDSISCDALDKRDGVDNRLRGAVERSLNTETFGTVSLGN